MKKLRLFMGVIALMLACVTAQAKKGDVYTIENLKYTVLTENTKTKVGTVSVVHANTNIQGHIIIPETILYNDITYTINTLGTDAFYNCKKMTSVELPTTLTKLSDRNFKSSGVNKIYVKDLSKLFSLYTYRNGCICPNQWDLYLNDELVETLVIPADAPEPELGLFANCKIKKVDGTALTNDPKFFQGMRKDVFKNCKQLQEVVFPDTLPNYDSIRYYIPDEWFSGCSALTKINIPYGIPNLGISLFKNCTALETIELPNTLNRVSSYLFDGCTNLKNVKLPENAIMICGYAFRNCSSLQTITLPLTITLFDGDCAFQKCSNLKEVVNFDKINISEIPNGTFWDCSKLGPKFILPESTRSIGGDCFENCTSLEEVEFPDSLNFIGQMAFSGCSKLKTLTNYENTQIDNINHSCFMNCKELETINYPKTVTWIGSEAFYFCWKLASINIHDNITSIGDKAFADCNLLRVVKIPNSVTSIGKEAFSVWRSNQETMAHITMPSWLKEEGSFIADNSRLVKEFTIPAYVENTTYLPMRYDTTKTEYSRSVYIMGDSIPTNMGDPYKNYHHKNTTLYVKKSVFNSKYPDGTWVSTPVWPNTYVGTYKVSYQIPLSMTNASGNPIEYKTMCRDFDVDLTHTNDNLPEGVEPLRAYLVEDVDGDLRMVFMNEIKYIPSRLKANVTDENGNLYQGVDEYVGVILRGTPGYTYYYEMGEHDYTQGAEGQWLMEDAMAYSSASFESNLMAGTANDEEFVHMSVENENNDEIINYGLNAGKFKIYFKDGWLTYNKSYLQLPKHVSAAIEGNTDADGNANLTFVFNNADGTTDKVSSVEFNRNCESDIFYNPYGQKVDAKTKGIVIKNGKKYVNK